MSVAKICLPKIVPFKQSIGLKPWLMMAIDHIRKIGKIHIRDATVSHFFTWKWILYFMQRVSEWVRERRNGKNGSIFITHHYDKIVQILLSYFHFASTAELSVRTTKKLSALESALLYYMLILTLLSSSRFCFFSQFSRCSALVLLSELLPRALSKPIFIYILDSIYVIALLLGKEFIFWIFQPVRVYIVLYKSMVVMCVGGWARIITWYTLHARTANTLYLLSFNCLYSGYTHTSDMINTFYT